MSILKYSPKIISIFRKLMKFFINFGITLATRNIIESFMNLLEFTCDAWQFYKIRATKPIIFIISLLL